MMNIQGYEDNNDPFYRYQMPLPILTLVKKKTQITNLEDLAKSLDRPTNMIMEFFKLLFSCSVKNNNINKKVTQEDVLDGLRIFIEHYVLCPQCKLPETNLNGKKIACICCSYSGPLIKSKHKIASKFQKKL